MRFDFADLGLVLAAVDGLDAHTFASSGNDRGPGGRDQALPPALLDGSPGRRAKLSSTRGPADTSTRRSPEGQSEGGQLAGSTWTCAPTISPSTKRGIVVVDWPAQIGAPWLYFVCLAPS